MGWQKADTGLFIGVFDSPAKSKVGDSKITIVKIDPAAYSFKLLCAGEKQHKNLTVKQWCQKYGLIGAVNAGMFQTDYVSNVGYMKNGDYVNNPAVHKNYFSVAAFHPVDNGPPFYIFDIDHYQMPEIIGRYHAVIQNLRLMKRPAQNRWSQQDKQWSEAALGQDKKGNALFIFSRSPYSMHDFINILRQLPIEIDCAQHLEGGPEASLYISLNDGIIERTGSFEMNFTEHDNNMNYWPVPNVIGFVKRE